MKKKTLIILSETCAGILEIERRQISSAHLILALQVKTLKEGLKEKKKPRNTHWTYFTTWNVIGSNVIRSFSFRWVYLFAGNLALCRKTFVQLQKYRHMRYSCLPSVLHSRSLTLSFPLNAVFPKRINFSFVCCIPHGIVHKLHIECCSIWFHLFKCAIMPKIYRNDEKQLTQIHTLTNVNILTLTLHIHPYSHTFCMCNEFKFFIYLHWKRRMLDAVKWFSRKIRCMEKFFSGYLHRTCCFIGFFCALSYSILMLLLSLLLHREARHISARHINKLWIYRSWDSVFISLQR